MADFSKRPRAVVCYICGRQYGTASIGIHIKSCQDKFLADESKKPAHLRRGLPPAPALFASFDTVTVGGTPHGGRITADALDSYNQSAFDSYKTALIKCNNCGRSFLEESLLKHQKMCTPERPFRAVGEKLPGGGGGAVRGDSSAAVGYHDGSEDGDEYGVGGDQSYREDTEHPPASPAASRPTTAPMGSGGGRLSGGGGVRPHPGMTVRSAITAATATPPQARTPAAARGNTPSRAYSSYATGTGSGDEGGDGSERAHVSSSPLTYGATGTGSGTHTNATTSAVPSIGGINRLQLQRPATASAAKPSASSDPAFQALLTAAAASNRLPSVSLLASPAQVHRKLVRGIGGGGGGSEGDGEREGSNSTGHSPIPLAGSSNGTSPYTTHSDVLRTEVKALQSQVADMRRSMSKQMDDVESALSRILAQLSMPL